MRELAGLSGNEITPNTSSKITGLNRLPQVSVSPETDKGIRKHSPDRKATDVIIHDEEALGPSPNKKKLTILQAHLKGLASGAGGNLQEDSTNPHRPFSYELPQRQGERLQPHPEILHLATRRTAAQSPSASTSEQSFIERTPSPQPPDLDSPITPNGALSPSSSDGRGGPSPRSPNSRSWQSGSLSDKSAHSSPRHRRRVASPLSATPSSPSLPTIIKPSIVIDSGLQVVEEHEPTPQPLHHTESHQPGISQYMAGMERDMSTRVSTSSESSRKELARMTGFFRFKKKSLDHPNDKPPPAHIIPEDLSFCFSAVGTALLMWRKRQTDHVARLILPFQNGQKLLLAPASQPGSLREDRNFSIKLVGAGNDLAVVVASLDNKLGYMLCCFDKYARLFETHLPDPGGLLPTALAVSRDDSKIAICCGGMVLIYGMADNVGPKLVGSVPAHSTGSNVPSNRRLQKANFSLDSTTLVTATQEYHGNVKSPYQVHVRLWRCLPDGPPVMEIELDPVVLEMGYGNDPGLSSIFCSIDHTNPMNSRVFLAAQTAKTYDYILMLSKKQKNKRVLLNEKSIGAAAQTMSPQNAPYFGSQYVFKNGRHDLYTMDIRTGVTQPLANFANERSGLTLDQETNMVVAFPHETLALAFWRSRKGELVLKQVDLTVAIAGRPPNIHTLELRDVFHRVSMQG